MPLAPPRACATCGGVGCTAHRRPAWQHQVPVRRVRGRRLQQMRRALFEQSPLCVVCERAGRITVATIRDHVVPLAEGGTDTRENTQALCQTCSDAKTAEEASRGIRGAMR